MREGDTQAFSRIFKDKGCKINIHPQGYRSVHYLIVSNPTKKSFTTEIQVRTIFEEGWSEIDHCIRYPYNMKNAILSQYLNIFNRFAGSADEMGTYIRFLQNELFTKEKKISEDKKKINQLKKTIEALKIDTKTKKHLDAELNQLFRRNSIYNLHPSTSIYGIPPEQTLLQFNTPETDAMLASLPNICSNCGNSFYPDSLAFNDKCPSCRYSSFKL